MHHRSLRLRAQIGRTDVRSHVQDPERPSSLPLWSFDEGRGDGARHLPGAPPELEGYSLGLVYEPVGHEVSGGDVFGVWRLPSGALRYANAGHVPPLLVHGADPGAAPVELRTTGLPLGVVDDATFEEHGLPFGAEHLLFAAKDGLIEARHRSELFGQERVTSIVARHAAAMSAQDLVERAYAEAEVFAEVLTDDVAIIALRPT